MRKIFIVNLLFFWVLIGFSCSFFKKYKNNGFCSEDFFDSDFIRQQGMIVSKIIFPNMVSANTDSVMVIDSSGIKAYFLQTQSKFRLKCKESDQVFDLSKIWPLNQYNQEPVVWGLTEVYRIKTSKRHYLNFEFISSISSSRESYNNLLFDVTNIENLISFIPPSSFYIELSNYGDFNNDSYLDYAAINDSLEIVEVFSFITERIKKVENAYLTLTEANIPESYFKVYKIDKKQKNKFFWK